MLASQAGTAWCIAGPADARELLLNHAAKSCAAAVAAGALSAVAGAGPAQLDAFPNIQVLDLRRTSISPFQLPALQRLAGRLRALQLTYLERVGRPHEYFAQLEVSSHPVCPDTGTTSCVLVLLAYLVGLLVYSIGMAHSQRGQPSYGRVPTCPQGLGVGAGTHCMCQFHHLDQLSHMILCYPLTKPPCQGS